MNDISAGGVALLALVLYVLGAVLNIGLLVTLAGVALVVSLVLLVVDLVGRNRTGTRL